MTSLAQKNRKSPSANWRKLVKVIENGKEVEVVEAAKQLINLRLRQSVRPLVRLLQKGRTAHVRENACYALGWMGFPHLNRVFIDCLRNGKESEQVRGQAAEALEMLHANGRPESRHYQIAEDALLASLSDSSPTVRFWCSFALGCMGSKRAVGSLSRLKRFDRGLCPGWWYVREEASDALDMIQGREPPHRIAVHMRPKSRK